MRLKSLDGERLGSALTGGGGLSGVAGVEVLVVGRSGARVAGEWLLRMVEGDLRGAWTAAGSASNMFANRLVPIDCQ